MTHNFDAIYSYNAAESYALAISLLSDRLKGAGPLVGTWPTNDRGLSRAERKELQALLTQRGYDVGTPDGAIGAKTHDAIKAYEAKLGLPQTGPAWRRGARRPSRGEIASDDPGEGRRPKAFERQKGRVTESAIAPHRGNGAPPGAPRWITAKSSSSSPTRECGSPASTRAFRKCR